MTPYGIFFLSFWLTSLSVIIILGPSMLLQMTWFHYGRVIFLYIYVPHVFFFFFLFMAVPVAYGSYWARVWIGAAAGFKLQPWKHQIQAAPETYATAYSNSGSLTHWARPGIEPTSSQRQHQVLNPLSHSGNSCTTSSLSIHLFLFVCFLPFCLF